MEYKRGTGGGLEDARLHDRGESGEKVVEM